MAVWEGRYLFAEVFSEGLRRIESFLHPVAHERTLAVAVTHLLHVGHAIKLLSNCLFHYRIEKWIEKRNREFAKDIIEGIKEGFHFLKKSRNKKQAQARSNIDQREAN